jgi:hypothetical protein
MRVSRPLLVSIEWLLELAEFSSFVLRILLARRSTPPPRDTSFSSVSWACLLAPSCSAICLCARRPTTSKKLSHSSSHQLQLEPTIACGAGEPSLPVSTIKEQHPSCGANTLKCSLLVLFQYFMPAYP